MDHRADGPRGLVHFVKRPFLEVMQPLAGNPNFYSKSNLRKECRRVRRERHRRGTGQDGRELAKIFLQSIKIKVPAKVSGYWPIQSEIDIRPLLLSLHSLGHTLCLPAIVAPAAPLQFRQWAPCDDLKNGPFNILEPQEFKPQLNPKVIIVPLLAFDTRGNRLGYGGGYYDRTLSSLSDRKIITIGVGYEAQLLNSVPADPSDVALDWIITEEVCRGFGN